MKRISINLTDELAHHLREPKALRYPSLSTLVNEALYEKITGNGRHICKGTRDYIKDLSQDIISAARDKKRPVEQNLAEIQAIAMELVMLMHYEKSADWYDKPLKPDTHPDYGRYARAYMAGDLAERSVCPEALAMLRVKFPPMPHPLLPSGYSEWNPHNKRPPQDCDCPCEVNCMGL